MKLKAEPPYVYNMPSGVPFLPSLAQGLKQRFGERLSDALILLPTRRAVRELGDCFAGEGGASLLPRMRPLADINPEEPPFEPGELAGVINAQIDPMQRRFELATLIAGYHEKTSDLPLSPSGALAMADPIIAILDDAAMEEADLSKMEALKELEARAAAHFQNAAVLYKIIQEYWERRLTESGQMEPFARRVALLNALADHWAKEPPNYPVIIAGSTGTLAASARLMACVSRLKDGMVVLPGLNDAVPTSVWEGIGVQHPQHSLKQLINTIGVDISAVKRWGALSSSLTKELIARRDVISESLVPVDATGDWPARIESIKAREETPQTFEKALEGLSIIEAENNEEEALTIALIMREVLETPEKTASLVTPDPSLARRVKARLRRWNVDIDYSQGEPLEETALGAFLTHSLALAEDARNPVELSVLCKHKLMALGEEAGNVSKAWRPIERKDYRGIRPSDDVIACHELINSINQAIAPLTDLDKASAAQWAKALAEVVEVFAATESETGAARLWVGDAGEKAAGLIESLIAQGHYLGAMSIAEFSQLFSNLMRASPVRVRFGTHPRLSILGPLEARMLTADTVILGGLNDGIWPAAPTVEPFLSRGMRQELGLSLPERRFGLSAHDFAELATNPDVILTRAKRSDEGPMVASRWLWRLQTLMRGALGDAADTALSNRNYYLTWARALDDVKAEEVSSAKQPKPTPPIEARWPEPRGRKLSITQIKTWIRDPYSIYAKHVLGLRPLDDLDMDIGNRDFGNAMHNGLEAFVKAYPKHLPKNSDDKLILAFEMAMQNAGFEAHEVAKDKSRLSKIAIETIRWMRERRETGWAVRGVETRAEVYVKDSDFTLTGKADLIEKGPHGYAANDYKTGAPTSVKVVNAGFDPQLPLTAFMLGEGAFENINSGPTEELNYIRLKGSGSETLVHSITPPKKDALPASQQAEQAVDALKKLIATFDDPATAYHSQPRAQFTHDYGDYDHLARRDEWARLGADAEGGVSE